TAFIWLLAFTIPPAPAGMKINIPMNGAKNRTSPQGNVLNQPNKPLAPFARPVISKVANSENAVIKEGMMTMNVRTTCRYFQNGANTACINQWWKPTGIEDSKKCTNDIRASASLNIFPSIFSRTMSYRLIYAASNQKYTRE